VALVERGGEVRSFRVANVTGRELKGAVRDHVEREARLMTDEFSSYRNLDREFASHETVAHSYGEYGRGEVHINTVEGYFSILKRGINGVYHHVSPAHLLAYLAEFSFRYNNRTATGVEDAARTIMALQQAEGKRLKYRATTRRAKDLPWD
jgi:hypothetical protein